MKIDAKSIIKFVAYVVVSLECFWVATGHEPHALAVCTGVASLFGINSAHEHFNDDDGGHGL
jgi:hypothetical protein